MAESAGIEPDSQKQTLCLANRLRATPNLFPYRKITGLSRQQY